MTKTLETITLEKSLRIATNKKGLFGCPEVTIGWYGKERVDYITFDTKGTWRCYEIKVSVPDFHSKAHNTFCGHFNYYVMPKLIYEKVKLEIPSHVGVYVDYKYHPFIISVKNAKRQKLTVDEDVLKNSMIRSLSRDTKKYYLKGDKL